MFCSKKYLSGDSVGLCLTSVLHMKQNNFIFTSHNWLPQFSCSNIWWQVWSFGVKHVFIFQAQIPGRETLQKVQLIIYNLRKSCSDWLELQVWAIFVGICWFCANRCNSNIAISWKEGLKYQQTTTGWLESICHRKALCWKWNICLCFGTKSVIHSAWNLECLYKNHKINQLLFYLSRFMLCFFNNWVTNSD